MIIEYAGRGGRDCPVLMETPPAASNCLKLTRFDGVTQEGAFVVEAYCWNRPIARLRFVSFAVWFQPRGQSLHRRTTPCRHVVGRAGRHPLSPWSPLFWARPSRWRRQSRRVQSTCPATHTLRRRERVCCSTARPGAWQRAIQGAEELESTLAPLPLLPELLPAGTPAPSTPTAGLALALTRPPCPKAPPTHCGAGRRSAPPPLAPSWTCLGQGSTRVWRRSRPPNPIRPSTA